MFKINKKGQKALNKYFALISIVSLVLQSLSGIFFLTPAFAQEETSVPTAIPTIEAAIITSTPETTPTQTPTETVAPTPVIEIPISTPTPVTELLAQPTPIVTEAPVLTVTPIVMPEETEPEVLAASLPQGQSPPPAGDLLPSGTDQTSAQLNPSISTDKSDYTPNETAIISGKDLKPNTEYKIVITADNFLFEDKFTTTEQGTFLYSFPLGGTYRPDYKVEIKEGDTNVVSTSFTDTQPSCSNILGTACNNDGDCCLADGLTCQGSGSDKTCQLVSAPTSTPTPTPTSIPAAPSSVQTIEASCMEVSYGGSLNCSAKDISLANITEQDITILDDGCISPTDTVTFKATWNVQSQADQRYNVGLYFAADGQDNALTGICSVSTIPNSPIPPWYDYDGNACGDINADTVLHPEITMTVQCSDPDGDNTLNMPYCTSWHQQVSACSTPADAIPLNPAKCNCDPGFQIPIYVPSGNLTVIKHVVNDGGGTNTASDFTINVTGVNPSISTFPGQETPGTSVVVEAGAYSVDEVELPHYQKSLSAGCSGIMTAGGAAVCTITNTYIPYCGDGVVGVGEECEDSQTQACQTTTGYNGIQTCSQCRWGSCEPTEWCGDGIVNDNEECDGLAGVLEHNICTASCILEYVPYCGDGIIDENLGEQCDDGNTNETDGCDNSCRALGSISGVKFQDNDGDSLAKEPGEPGLSGWTIEIRDLAGALIGSAVTGTDGSYAIPNLLEGTYNVCEVTQSPDWTRTYPGNDCYFGVVLNPGSDLSGYDFGNFRNVDITACKYIDSDGDGQGDIPYTTGWLMTLTKNGQVYNSEYTGLDGCYTWTNLGPGSYSVTEETKSDWTSPVTAHDFGVVLSGQNESFTFGNFENVSVTACKYTDADGFLITGDDQGVKSGWPVYLTIDGQRQTVQNTGTNGCYTWTDLGPNHSYGVEEDVATGWTALTMTSHVFDPPTSGNTTYSYDFINTALGKITVEKQTTPNTDTTTEFEFSASYKSNFFLHNMDTDTSEWLIPGQYTVSELPKTGWDTSNLSCSDSDQGTTINGATAYIDLDAGQEVHCTFDNTQRGKIIIQKNAILNSSQLFTFRNNFANGNPAVFTLADDATPGYGSRTFEVLPGTYIVSEDSASGWQSPESAICDQDETIDDIDVAAGETVTCLFTNEKLAKITLVKNTVGDNGTFDFIMTGQGLPATAQILTIANTGSQTYIDLDPDNLYSLAETVPVGWDLNSATCDNGDLVSNITPNAGEEIICTFTNTKKGSVSGQKYNDLNGDGNKDGGEDGLSGWTIKLMNETGNGELNNTLTDSQGNYNFSNVLPGNYQVCEINQNDWTNTEPGGGIFSPVCDSMTVVAGQNTVIDFGNFRLGMIQSRKYEDLNNDSTRDIGERYLNNWTIRLYRQGEGWEYVGERLTGHTGVQGQYRFSDLDKGTYYLCEVLRGSEWIQTDPRAPEGFVNRSGAGDEAPRCRKVIISQSGQESIGEKHFGNYQYGQILVCKYDDLNGDGRLGEEPTIAGVQMDLYKWIENQPTITDGPEVAAPFGQWLFQTSQNTGENGCTLFDNLLYGEYKIGENVHVGYYQTSPLNPDYFTASVQSGTNLSFDFLNAQFGSIGDTIYEDVNGNGTQDLPVELGIDGVTVNLYFDDDGDGIVEPNADDGGSIATEITNGSGVYLFPNLIAGAYLVDVDETTLPVGYSLTTANDPAPVALTPGQPYDLADFGYKPIPPSIELKKTNDKSSGASVGDIVTYTLTLKNGPVPLSNITVTDVLPLGFTYVSGSTNSTEASFTSYAGSTIKWTIISLADGATATIIYQAKIDSSQQAGRYYNLAICQGSASRGEIGNDALVARPTQIAETANCNLASSEVPIGQTFSYSATIGGSVLGVSTVLGAATGSETYWLIMAIIMMASGLLIVNRKRFIK